VAVYLCLRVLELFTDAGRQVCGRHDPACDGLVQTSADFDDGRQIMQLRFLGKESTPTNSPTLYASDAETYIVQVLENGNYIIQGRRVDDAEALGQMSIPDFETCVEVPKAAMRALLVGA
jgi:hypothetical protein